MRWGPRCVTEGVAPILRSRDLRATAAFYALREFALVDANGNLLRIGSPLPQAG
jgi:hypothetical protein